MIKNILSLVLFLSCISLHAHTVWIEANPNGKLNKTQEVKIFFGEPDSPTFTEKWFSDIKDLRNGSHCCYGISPAGIRYKDIND